jgi:argininosuccinate synthase
MKERVVLAFSGGLRSALALSWLVEQPRTEVVAVTLDVGQGGELAGVRDRALAAGAVRCHVLDVRDELVRDFILPTLQAGVFETHPSSLAVSLTRPLIARTLAAIAQMEQATSIVCGVDEGGVRLIESSIRAIDRRLRVIRPPDPASASGAWRIESTVWGRVVETNDVATAPPGSPEDLFTLTREAAEAPDVAAHVEVTFEAGVPVAVNGIPMPFRELVESLSTIAGSHGVGRSDCSTTARGPRVARRILEAPAADLLERARACLALATGSGDLLAFQRNVAGAYADLIERGAWFSPLRDACDAFVRNAQRRMSGTIRLSMYKGAARVISCAPDVRPALTLAESVGVAR